MSTRNGFGQSWKPFLVVVASALCGATGCAPNLEAPMVTVVVVYCSNGEIVTDAIVRLVAPNGADIHEEETGEDGRVPWYMGGEGQATITKAGFRTVTLPVQGNYTYTVCLEPDGAGGTGGTGVGGSAGDATGSSGVAGAGGTSGR